MVQWPTDEAAGKSFANLITEAVLEQPRCLLLDEVRADEPDTVMPLLTMSNPPRLLWTFRGQAEPKRLSAALGMLARRSADQSEQTLHALYQRLPFVIALRRRSGRLFVSRISEWQAAPDAMSFSLVEIMSHDGEQLTLTGHLPLAQLDLPAEFWKS